MASAEGSQLQVLGVDHAARHAAVVLRAQPPGQRAAGARVDALAQVLEGLEQADAARHLAVGHVHLLAAQHTPGDQGVHAVEVSGQQITDAFLSDTVNGSPRAKFQSVVLPSAAAPLSADQVKALAETLKAKLGKTVTLNQFVDPSLIGGLQVKVGSQLIDSSLKTKLAAMKIAMKEVG